MESLKEGTSSPRREKSEAEPSIKTESQSTVGKGVAENFSKRPSSPSSSKSGEGSQSPRREKRPPSQSSAEPSIKTEPQSTVGKGVAENFSKRPSSSSTSKSGEGSESPRREKRPPSQSSAKNAQPSKKRRKQDTTGKQWEQGGVKKKQPGRSTDPSPKILESTAEKSRDGSPAQSSFSYNKDSPSHNEAPAPTQVPPRKRGAEDSMGSAQPAKKGRKQGTADIESDRGTPEGKSRIEVSFALDCSSSGKEEKSGEDKILTQIKFVKDMIKCWNISMNHVKDYHLVVYGDTAGKLPLDQSNKSLSDHLQELKIGKWSESRCRRMDLALKEAAKCFRSDPNEIYHLIVLITSGKQGSDNESRREGGQPEKFLESAATTTAGKKGSDNDNEEGGKGLLESVAEELFSEKIKVIVVPVGLENDFQELGLIVKRPQYLFPLSSFKDMDYDTAKKIALNIEATVDLEKYAKDAFDNFQDIVSPESESALWENIRVCSDVLEGTWYKLYEDSGHEKVKMLIRENIDNFLSTLVTESKVDITLAVFGPQGKGKSFFLNTLLSWGLDSRKVQNGPLPSGLGKSQTLLPIYIKYGRNVQVSLHKEKTEPNPTPCFYEEEIGIGTFDRVKNTLESILKEKDAKYVELRGPFPVFKQLNERKMTRSELHLELEVDVQFVDVPGLGDKRGDSYVSVALGKADIVLFFDSGDAGRGTSAEDIAQIFRRREKFEFISRPKLVHIFNDRRPSLSLSETFDGLSKEKQKDLEDEWEHLREESVGEKGIYKQVRKKISPELHGELLLEKISSESKVIYFHLKNNKVLDSLKEVINDHVQTVKRKQVIHPVLQLIYWAATKLKLGVGQRLSKVKKKKSDRPVKPAEVNFEVQLNTYEADELCKLFAEKRTEAMLKLDEKSVKEYLFNNFILSQETLKFLLETLTDSLVMYTNKLIEAFTNENLPLVEECPADVLDLIELLCLSRVKNFSTNTAPEYLLHFLNTKSRQITLPKAETLQWKRASVDERTDLIPRYLSILLFRTEELLEKDTRGNQYKKSHFQLMKTIKEIVKELLAARSLHDASRTACLASLKKKLPIIIDFCRKSIRVINPHPEMNAHSHLSLPSPKDMKSSKEDHKVPSQSSHRQIIDEMKKLLCGTKTKGAKNIIRQMETKLKFKDHGYLEPRGVFQVDQLLWGKALITALSDKDYFNIPPQSEDEKISKPSLVLSTDETQNVKLLDQAKKRLFAHKKSSVTCKIVIEESVHANEIHLRKNDQEKCLEVLVSSTTCQTLDEIRDEFKDPSQHCAPIFIPTIRDGSSVDNRGNYFLEEDPWSRVSAEGIRVEEEAEEDEEQRNAEKETSGISGCNQNIFLVVERRHLFTLQNTISILGPPRRSKIRLIYVVLPQNGRGIGVTRAIIKTLAECLNFFLYWTIDDDIKFMHHFDQNDRKWHKCSITRGLLFAQRVFQACLQKTTNELFKKDRVRLYKDATKDWPDFTSEIEEEICSLLVDKDSFAKVQKNPSLLRGPFSNIPADIRDDKEKQDVLKECEEEFVEKCTKRLFKDTLNHIAGVSIAHVLTRRSDYMSKYPNADYMPSEQRYQVVLNNTCALKGKNFVTDEVIFHEEEYQINDKDKRNTPYWGIRGEDKSFNRALKVSGVIGYQVIRIVHSQEKLRNVFDRVGPSYIRSASPHRSEDEENDEEEYD